MFLNSKKPDVTTKLVQREPGYCLLASFENSVPPVVWRHDLAKNPTFSLSLRGSGDDWTLGITEHTQHKADFVSIARFDNREEAEDAYAAVQKALFNKPFRLGALVIPVVLLAVFLLVVYSFMTRNTDSNRGETAPVAPTSEISKPAPKKEFGVPLSADEVLQGQ